MLQLEREKAGHQLAEIEKLRTALSKINTEERQGKVCTTLSFSLTTILI